MVDVPDLPQLVGRERRRVDDHAPAPRVKVHRAGNATNDRDVILDDEDRRSSAVARIALGRVASAVRHKVPRRILIVLPFGLELLVRHGPRWRKVAAVPVDGWRCIGIEQSCVALDLVCEYYQWRCWVLDIQRGSAIDVGVGCLRTVDNRIEMLSVLIANSVVCSDNRWHIIGRSNSDWWWRWWCWSESRRIDGVRLGCVLAMVHQDARRTRSRRSERLDRCLPVALECIRGIEEHQYHGDDQKDR